mmetsp:Transcript_68068/g.159617  ORF Transcript_68068/g.159617 Transcript_68068/m.159617 type:complete len:566 (+) Transcript_68068:725-2422(+)
MDADTLWISSILQKCQGQERELGSQIDQYPILEGEQRKQRRLISHVAHILHRHDVDLMDWLLGCLRSRSLLRGLGRLRGLCRRRRCRWWRHLTISALSCSRRRRRFGCRLVGLAGICCRKRSLCWRLSRRRWRRSHLELPLRSFPTLEDALPLGELGLEPLSRSKVLDLGGDFALAKELPQVLLGSCFRRPAIADVSEALLLVWDAELGERSSEGPSRQVGHGLLLEPCGLVCIVELCHWARLVWLLWFLLWLGFLLHLLLFCLFLDLFLHFLFCLLLDLRLHLGLRLHGLVLLCFCAFLRLCSLGLFHLDVAGCGVLLLYLGLTCFSCRSGCCFHSCCGGRCSCGSCVGALDLLETLLRLFLRPLLRLLQLFLSLLGDPLLLSFCFALLPFLGYFLLLFRQQLLVDLLFKVGRRLAHDHLSHCLVATICEALNELLPLLFYEVGLDLHDDVVSRLQRGHGLDHPPSGEVVQVGHSELHVRLVVAVLPGLSLSEVEAALLRPLQNGAVGQLNKLRVLGQEVIQPVKGSFVRHRNRKKDLELVILRLRWYHCVCDGSFGHAEAFEG